MYYAGIGSRKTPPEVLEAFKYLGAELAKRGFILRSGGADGADSAFEKGCDKVAGEKEVYLPWKGFNKSSSPLYIITNEAEKCAAYYHPRYYQLSSPAQKLIARDGYQVLGADLQTPSSFVICYTENGSGSGGTGQALRIAKHYDIKVCDFGRFPKERAFEYAEKVLNVIDKELYTLTKKMNVQEMEI